MIQVIVVLTAASVAQQPTIPVDGPPFSAQLTGIDSDWNVAFEVEGKRRTIPAANLVSWGGLRERGNGPAVLLVGGGRLVARVLALQGDRLVVDSPLWGQVSLPLESVRGIVFAPPAGLLQRDRLEQRVAVAAGERDQLLLENGDSLTGLLTAPGDAAGPLRTSDPIRQITLDTDAGKVAVAVEKIEALIFNPALVAVPRAGTGMRALVGFNDGSSLLVAQINDERGLATVTLAGGVRLTTDSASLWEEVALLQPFAGRVDYLSDLKPLGYKHIPFLQQAWPYKIDGNVLGGKLRTHDHVYAKGLGMHSTSRLAYTLDGRYKRFEAELALDAAAGDRGSVTCRIFIDEGQGNWKPAYASPVVRGGERPVSVSIDVRGAARLALIVDFADRGGERDYANLLNARLIVEGAEQ